MVKMIGNLKPSLELTGSTVKIQLTLINGSIVDWSSQYQKKGTVQEIILRGIYFHEGTYYSKDGNVNLKPLILYVEENFNEIKIYEFNFESELKSISRSRLTKTESNLLKPVVENKLSLYKKINKESKKDILFNSLNTLDNDNLLITNNKLFVLKRDDYFYTFEFSTIDFVLSNVSNDVEKLFVYLKDKIKSNIFKIDNLRSNRNIERLDIFLELITTYNNINIISDLMDLNLSYSKICKSIFKKAIGCGLFSGNRLNDYVSYLKCLPLDLLENNHKIYYSVYKDKNYYNQDTLTLNLENYSKNLNYSFYTTTIDYINDQKKLIDLPIGYETIYNKINRHCKKQMNMIPDKTLQALKSDYLKDFLDYLKKDDFPIGYSESEMYFENLDFIGDYDRLDYEKASREMEVEYFFTEGVPLYVVFKRNPNKLSDFTTLSVDSATLILNNLSNGYKNIILSQSDYSKDCLNLLVSIILSGNDFSKCLFDIKQFMRDNNLANNEEMFNGFLKLRKELTVFNTRDRDLTVSFGTFNSIINSNSKKEITKNDFKLNGFNK